MGPEKKSHVVTDEERRLTAYHETGHAITGYFSKHHDPVHQISIISRGGAGGYTMYLPEKDPSYVTKTAMFENIVTSLGGRVAEQLVLEDISTGASSDLEQATKTARAMVTRYGFSERLGPVVYGGDPGETFLGRDFGQGKGYSEAIASEIDNEIRDIVDEAYPPYPDRTHGRTAQGLGRADGAREDQRRRVQDPDGGWHPAAL